MFSATCEFTYGIPRDVQKRCASMVNEKMETGSLYPKANITVLPRPLFRNDGPDESLMRTCIRDAFVVERDYIKSSKMILEFTCSNVSYDLVYFISKELCENEFADVAGTAILLHDRPVLQSD